MTLVNMDLLGVTLVFGASISWYISKSLQQARLVLTKDETSFLTRHNQYHTCLWDLIQQSKFHKKTLVKRWLYKMYRVEDSLALQIKFDQMPVSDCTKVKEHLESFKKMFAVRPRVQWLFT